jgi:ribonuclease HI
MPLPNQPVPTGQRAELTAIVLALEQALEKSGHLRNKPLLDIKIHSDSGYAISCMNEIHAWRQNGWTTTAGHQIRNRDLMDEAFQLHNSLLDEGAVE